MYVCKIVTESLYIILLHFYIEPNRFIFNVVFNNYINGRVFYDNIIVIITSVNLY